MQNYDTNKDIKKVLLLGSGGLSIGQAGEFDYSGTQAINALREEGIEVLILNPNIATVQTNPRSGTKVFLYPVTPSWVEKIFIDEKPDSIIGGFGGQTALNCLIDLEKQGILKKYGVRNLGTAISTLLMTEDRQLFAERMQTLGIAVPESYACKTKEQAIEAADSLGFPVIVRAAFALGGLGSGFAKDKIELGELAQKALANSPQILVETSLKGWKEVEYEVMRDRFGNTITICNMENLDALGVHTGDSIVVCPSQSLNDSDYQNLRNASLALAESFEIVGECNAQFALSPDSSQFYIIEVNARLSRSSALASKASGYPIAHIAAKVVLGHDLISLKNPVTGITSAFYEPALDYVTVKVPRWDLVKFSGADRNLGSTMKSVGEVMAIGRSFTEALQKSIRMVTESDLGLSSKICATSDLEDLKNTLARPTDLRLYAVLESFRRGLCLEEINELSHIDPWFLVQIKMIADCERSIRDLATQHRLTHDEKENSILSTISAEIWRHWKVTGFSDQQIALLLFSNADDSSSERVTNIETLSSLIRSYRHKHGVKPVVKRIDTTAAEYPSPSNYFYLTYLGDHHDPVAKDSRIGVMILGSGAYRIGTSVEFDWCAVTCSETLRKSGYRSIMLNCNPETVSTDYSSSDRLYFEEISLERILDIQEIEGTAKIITSMGGQLPNKIAGSIASHGLEILGHDAKTIDSAENRKIFSSLLDQLGIDQPNWAAVKSIKELENFIELNGFPILIRPSYVLSGAAMNVVYNRESLDRCLNLALDLSNDSPIVVSQFILGAREIELDGVASNGEIITNIVSEHIENAGIHSGDATTVVPAQRLFVETVRQVKRAARLIAKGLNLHGPFNIQFLATDNHIRVIECNARAARSFPFISKAVGLNLAKVATEVLCGQEPSLGRYNEDEMPHVGVKAAMFSFTRLLGADPVSGVEMSSTGEVGCIANSFEEAFLLAMESSNIPQPKQGVLISAGSEKEKLKFLAAAEILSSMKIDMYATEGTGKFLQEHGYQVQTHSWSEQGMKEVLDLIRNRQVDLVLNCPKNFKALELSRGSTIRQTAAQVACPLLTNMEKIITFVKAIKARETLAASARPQALSTFHHLR